MARINLLPWRAERQKERKKQFMLMLVLSAVAGLGLWFLVSTCSTRWCARSPMA
mgnify:CR=1 FL=1